MKPRLHENAACLVRGGPLPTSRMSDLLSFEDARRLVLASVSAGPTERVPLAEALGRTLARAVESGEDQPAFDNSAMDGFAVRAGDLAEVPVALRVAESVAAGGVPGQPIGSGVCAEIMTGAPLPAGANAVVPVEWTERVDEATVRVLQAVPEGRHVRRAGEDVRHGDRLFEAGQPATPPVVTMCALVGVVEVAVYAVPRVAVIATGDELVEAGAERRAGQVRNANGPGLAAQVRSAGGEPAWTLHAADTPAALRAALDQTGTADVVVLAGGVSAGRHDHVRPVLRGAGADLLVHGVRQRPGKPFTFALLDGRPVFGLPGNPTSAAVCFEAYVRPALARMTGRPARGRLPAVLDEPVAKKEGFHHLLRGHVWVDPEGRLRARPVGQQASGFFVPFSRATGLIHIREDAGDLPAGARVEVEVLPWASLSALPPPS